MACLIKNVKKPEIKAVPIIIDMLINNVFCNVTISVLELFLIKCSTAVSELPINLGATKEKTLAIMVIKKPKSNFFLYFKRYLFRCFNSFIYLINMNTSKLIKSLCSKCDFIFFIPLILLF